MNHPRFVSSSRAFTLIELLAVVLIVLVLAALLTSSVSNVMEGGKGARNISNLKALGGASLTYAADNNGSLPPTTQNLTKGGGQGLFMTTGIDMWPGASPRRLYEEERWPFGTGKAEYLGNPDVLYGPFTSALNKFRPSGVAWERAPTSYRIGYVYYFLPLEDDSDRASGGAKRKAVLDPSGRPLVNSSLAGGHPRAPLYSDMISESWASDTGFPWSKRESLYVVHLDGSVDAVPLERIKTSKENKIFTMSGYVRDK
jgi:prepilin-type N-terminal cleavage/methylation domain-containing protein